MEMPQVPSHLPQQKGQDYLELLVNTDFADKEDLFFAHAMRSKYDCEELMLYEHTVPGDKGKKKKDDMTYRYYVVMHHTAENHLGASYRPSDQPGSNMDISYSKPKQVFASMVMALQVDSLTQQDSSRGRMSSSRSSEKPPQAPRFVVEIGEIKVETCRHRQDGSSGIEEVRSPGCHMVMDIETPPTERALWLVHRHKGVEKGVHLKIDRKWDRDDDLFDFLGLATWDYGSRRIPAGFDVAQLATRAEDWYGKARRCSSIEDLPALMKATAMRGNCRLVTPEGLFEEFKAKVSKDKDESMVGG